MVIEYQNLKEEVFKVLKDRKVMVLATSADNRVTARSMSCVVIESKICFQTDRTFIKYHQIIQNPKVALAIDNIQIEGTATIKEHPFDEGNQQFTEAFKKIHQRSYSNYSHMENEVVIEVTPTLITLWKYEEGKTFRDFLDLANEKAIREYYDNTK